MNLEEFKKLLDEADDDPVEILGAEVVDEGTWENDYKDYAYKTIIVKIDQVYFAVHMSRSGSAYTDYFYDKPEVEEVVPVEVTTIQYVSKKN